MFGFGLFVYAAAGIMLAGNGGDLDDSVIFGLILAVVILLPLVFYYRLSKNMSYKQTATSWHDYYSFASQLLFYLAK
jgi:hypothetical protein